MKSFGSSKMMRSVDLFLFSWQFPPCYKDISLWINDSFTENNLCEIVRDIAGDLAEEVKILKNI